VITSATVPFETRIEKVSLPPFRGERISSRTSPLSHLPLPAAELCNWLARPGLESRVAHYSRVHRPRTGHGSPQAERRSGRRLCNPPPTLQPSIQDRCLTPFLFVSSLACGSLMLTHYLPIVRLPGAVFVLIAKLRLSGPSLQGSLCTTRELSRMSFMDTQKNGSRVFPQR